MYNNMTYDQCISKACEELVGCCDIGGSTLQSYLAFYLEREPNEDDMDAAEKYMGENGICDCSVCGWITDDQDGPDGDMCSDCAEDMANDEDSE